MGLMPDDDLGLVQAMARGESFALDELYHRHGGQLLNYLIGQLSDRALAEEVLQNVMLSAWKAAPNFRAESKVRTWLIAIARNQAINARRKKRVTAVPLHENDPSHKTGPMELAIRHAEEAEVRRALQQLSDDHRETLELVFYHGLSGPEVADILGISVGTVKSRLHRAKATLKQILTEEGRA